jgi:hypothetical protein
MKNCKNFNFQFLKGNFFKVNLNFFGDKHGKNNRDTHFSNVSRFILAESLCSKLESSQDIANAITKRQMMAKENRPGKIHPYMK